MEVKICSKCKEEKEICEFNKDKTRKDGFENKCKECKKKYYEDNKDKISIVGKLYRKNNFESIKQRHKEYHQNNPNYYKEWGKKNPDKIKDKISKWLKKNPTYFTDKYKNDLFYKLKSNMRSRLNTFIRLNNLPKKYETFDMIGCSPEFLKEYLEQKFTEGMSWELMGQHIHIDHIIPLSSANTEEEVYKLCHYTNLQPLWAFDNLSKGSKIL